ncbi:hypothetical protein FCH28_21265 [Streptomyces piniterrae]|uniref:Uncharacterized protein n=2 Tax=Streptomyces piniterrae TaxID=2571125 RepID=A0A4V5MK04_9ACTN|nr:hypothetical protein FCH28_21265 [Streptomyces piniterrae]
MAATGTVALSGCGGQTQKVGTEPPKKQDPFERRADQIERDWPKVSPVSGRKDAMLPLVGADRPKDTATREITVTVGHGACDAKYGVHTHESKGFVVVAGWSKKKNAKGMCTEQLATDKVKVRLTSPLDDRKIVDAATGKQLAGK